MIFAQPLSSGIAGPLAFFTPPDSAQSSKPVQSSGAIVQSGFALGQKDDTKRRTMQEDESRQQDDDLIARTQAGDAAAFDDLIVKYSPRLYGLVYNMTSNHEDTNDLLQDIWSKAFRSINGFRGRSSFPTWMHSISVNMTINFLKKRGRRFHMSLDDVDSKVQHDKEFIELTSASTPAHETNLKELQVRLNEAMQKLSNDHRAVVTMFDIQGMAHAEIAKILGISEGTVRSRLFYAHRQLQNFLSEFH
ncbi:MAG: rpoE [Chthoniobacteraceae bacterium]|nr:rpoE [Chthoniobacteraceae bacterium]